MALPIGTNTCDATIDVHWAATLMTLRCDGKHNADGQHHAQMTTAAEVLWTDFHASVDALNDPVWEHR